MKYNYQLIVTEEEAGEIIRISAVSEEDLMHQLHDCDRAIQAFEEKQLDYAKDNGEPESNEE